MKYAYFEIEKDDDHGINVDCDVVLYDSNDNVVERILLTSQELAIGPEFALKKMGYEFDSKFEMNAEEKKVE